MATARLRKAFRYPEDSGDDDHREELDEEEQERVIVQLQLQNDKRNAQYTMIFAAIPLLSTTAFISPLLSASSTVSERSLSFLSIISLAATTYIMAYFPLHPDRKGKKPIYKTDYTESVRKNLVPGNAGVCALLLLVYLLSSPTSQRTGPGLYLVPGALLSAILAARKVMISVDIKYLEDLRYEFKGA